MYIEGTTIQIGGGAGGGNNLYRIVHLHFAYRNGEMKHVKNPKF